MKKLLLECLREKIGSLYIIYYIFFSVLAFFIDDILAYVMIFSIVIFTAFQITRMFSAQSINCINTGYSEFRKGKSRYQLSMSCLANLVWLFCMEIKALPSSLNMVLGIFLIWLYAIIIGVTIGNVLENEVFGYIFIIGCFFIGLQKTLLHELYFRYISPVLFFQNEFWVFNILGIVILVIAGLLAIFLTNRKHLTIITFCVGLCFIGLLVCEVQYEKKISANQSLRVEREDYVVVYNSSLNSRKAENTANIIHETESCLKEYGFNYDTSNFKMECSIYFPWESNQEKVLLTYADDLCNINFYTESMREIKDDELITRYIYSRLSQCNQLQEAAVQILIDDVISQVLYDKRTEMLNTFSYEYLTEIYGYCASPKQCIVVECIKNDRKSFATLYALMGEIENLNEINIDKLSANDEFIKVFRGIVK